MGTDKREAPPRNVEWEIARLKAFDIIRTDTVTFEVGCDEKLRICFDIETDTLLDADDSPILDVEPIVFCYETLEAVGRVAPNIYSGRSSFPRSLPHLNPNPANEPAWLCLARSGLQQIYNIGGVRDVVIRLTEWLSDAQLGTLHKDGWEPVPTMGYKESVIGRIDAKTLQNHAKSVPAGGGCYLVAELTFTNGKVHFVAADGPPIELSNNEQFRRAQQLMGTEPDPSRPNLHTAIPAVFVWPNNDVIEEVPHFNLWRDMESLTQGLRDTGLYKPVAQYFSEIEPIFRILSPHERPHPEIDHSGSKHAQTRDKKALLLIIGLWRPTILDPAIVGLSDDQEARKLELRVFYLERPANEGHWSHQTTVRDFYGLVPVTTELLAATSGELPLPSTAILGVGALGSSLAEFALRSGASNLIVFDQDILLPHNLARHSGIFDELIQKKAKIVGRQAYDLMTGVNVSPFTDDICGLDDETLRQRCEGAALIIDTTADPLVRQRLSQLQGLDCPLVRSEIFHRGRLGVHMATNLNGDENLNFLYHYLVSLAKDEQWVREWLAYEATEAFREEELLIGFGCSSKTTKMPCHQISAHASTAFALAKSFSQDEFSAPRIVLNRLGTDGLSEGSKIHIAPKVRVFNEANDLNGWNVVVSKDVVSKIQTLRSDALPNETGGYLFGGIDEAAMEIYVVEVSPEPPGTIASPTSLELGPAGRHGYEQTLARRTSNRLPLIGTWHSHPNGPGASSRDRETVSKFRAQDKKYGLPTLMMIVGNTGERVYVAKN